MLIWNERRRLQREKRLGPARGKRPPVVEHQQSSLTEPFYKKRSMGMFLCFAFYIELPCNVTYRL
ncbi:MAG: hypothetical protein ACE3JN_11935 [Ectobacillus sp.]